MLCSSIAVTIFLWTIFYDVVEQLGLKKKSPYVAIVMVGITIMAYLGNSVLPFGAFLQIGIAVMTAVNPAVCDELSGVFHAGLDFVRRHAASAHRIFQTDLS